jgi:hypothetical protein
MLKVSANKRFLVHDDGAPFFYLGDTAWELFHRLNREEAAAYLEDRAAKGFTVIQAVALAEVDGLRVPNALGDLPLDDGDPARPNERYFAHVDYVVERAAALGLHVALLPTWGDKWNAKWGLGPEIFNPNNARAYGQWIGRRYADAPIIWVLGGDRPVESEAHRATVTAMAEGLREGDGGRHLIGFHPRGQEASSQYFHDAGWLDFNMVQTGHSRNAENWRFIEADYARAPTKPCMDAEPGYEDHPAGFKLENGYLDDYDVRKALYWSLFAGAHGHTYGCHPIWQFWHADRGPISFVRRHWREALALPGSAQVGFARSLLRSRPFLSRVPDQSLIASAPGEGARHVRATRDASGSYALVYLPYYDPVTIDLTKLSGEAISAHWYNPRNGAALRIGAQARAPQVTFQPPAGGPDWVLVLDDAARGYPPPGSQTYAERDGGA